MNAHGKLALEHIEHTRCTGKDDGCSAYARADLVALLAHCERLERVLETIGRMTITGGSTLLPGSQGENALAALCAIGELSRAALAAKVTP